MRFVRFVCLFVILGSAMLAAQSNPVPLINQPLVPETVAPGSGGFTLTVNGTGFGPNAAVYWNGSIRSTSVLSGSTMQAQITASDVANVGTGWVTAANPGEAFSNVVYLPIRESALGLGFLQKNPIISDTGPVVLGDFNNDGKLDVVVADQLTIKVFLGKGNGTFGSPITTTSNIRVARLAAGDFNGDGILDLVVLGSVGGNNDRMAVLLGNGDGTFSQKQSFDGPSHSSYMSVADFNGDGNLDLYVGGNDHYGGPYFEILLGNGDGTFRVGGGGNFDCGEGPPAIGDFNGDGLLDIAAIDTCDEVVDVFLNSGNGFQGRVSYPLPTFGGSSLAAADLNGDGKLDLVTDGVSVLLGNGDGTFSDDGGVLSGGSGSVNVGDFNGDGNLDVAAGLSMLLGNGDGTFQSPLMFAGLFPNQAVSMGDINGDGKLDLIGAVANTTLSLFVQVRVYLTPVYFNFGTQNIGTTSPPQTASLTNFDANPLIITGINISGTNSKDFAQTNNCGTGLPPNGSCQIQVTFTPSLAGQENASLNVSYHNSGTLSMPLSGVGENLVFTVTLTPPSLTYPVQLVGTTSSPQTATLTNTGNQPVTITNISSTSPFSETNNCPASLPVGSACQIQVVFTPTNPGTVKGTLSVTDNAQGSPQTVSLSGIGKIVKLAPSSINFGNQKVGTTSVPIPITLTNVGTVSLSISQIAIKGTDPADFAQTNNCGTSVPPQGQCKITVTFTPTAIGHRSARVSVRDTGGGSPQTVPLSGTGT